MYNTTTAQIVQVYRVIHLSICRLQIHRGSLGSLNFYHRFIHKAAELPAVRQYGSLNKKKKNRTATEQALFRRLSGAALRLGIDARQISPWEPILADRMSSGSGSRWVFKFFFYEKLSSRRTKIQHV